MPIIQDDRKRMIAYIDEASKMCNGSCSNCPTKDDRLHSDPTIFNWLMNEYWQDRVADVLPTDICSLGLSLAKRMQKYGLKNPSWYSGKIIKSAESLQKNSVEKVDPVKIKSNMSFLRAYLNLSKEMLPPPAVIEFSETPPKEIHSIEISLPETETTKLEIPASRISKHVKRLLQDFHYSLFF
jgi:hypothetical protein